MKKTPKMLKVEARIGEPLEDFLRRKYGEDGRSIREISDELDMGEGTIYYWLKKYDVQMRSLSETQLLPGVIKLTKKELKRLFDKEGSILGVAREVGVSEKTIRNWSKEFGVSEILTRKPNGYWQDWSNVEGELREIIEQEGEFPTQKRLTELGYGNLGNAITKNHGGLIAVRERMGYTFSRKSNRYWQDWSNVEGELREIIEQEGEFPTRKRLRAGRSSLARAINQYHGGFPKVRKKLGFDLKRKPNGYWQDWSNVEGELREIIHNLGHFPSQRELEFLGRKDLINAVNIYKGLLRVRERMGYAQVKTNDQLMDFLEQDETARNLAALVVVNGQGGYDVERVMVELYGNKFPSHPDLHRLLQENEDTIKELIEKGITNLGAYIGEYALGDRTIIPVLIGQALAKIPDKFMTTSLEDRLFRSLRSTYSPRFNEEPEEVLAEVKEKVGSTEGKEKSMYQRLQTHYEKVISLGGELNA